MTAPIWLAFPPEVHSTLLSSGPGPGPLLAAAGAWSALSTEYADAADELTGLLGAVQAGAWQGPSAEQYVAAHAPYLSWLLASSADSTAAAALHETAAGAYTVALAAMPTLGELAANHAIHGALLATNFFGINTIPIAVNEADYARMWVQAATTMSTYEAVSESALAAVPPSTPAPQIMTAAADTTSTTQQQATTAAQQYPSWMDQLEAWLRQYTSSFAWPVSKQLNPGGWPFPPVPWVNSLASFFTQLGLSPTLASAMGWAIFHTLMIFWPFIQVAVQLAVVAIPAMMLVAAAAGAGAAAGAAAIAVGTAVPLAIQPPLPAMAPAPMPTAPAPAGFGNVPTSSSASAPATAPATATAAPAGAAPPAGAPPGVGFGPTSTSGLGAGLSDALYAVGLSGLSGSASAKNRSRRKSAEPAPDDADAPAAAVTAAAKERLKARRRRGATAKDKAYRYEYMDLEDAAAGPDDEPSPSIGESGHAAGPLGFAGAAAKSGASRAAGLTTLGGDGLNDGPVVPMLPSSWGRHDGK
jgi:PPE-repeat protein